MNDHTTHVAHEHTHGPDCGHETVAHEGHTDYLHTGHLHRPHGDHVDEHSIPAGADNPERCTPEHGCAAHDETHVHDEGCGHEPVPHADHVDYLVDGHLHQPHATHCDDHGALAAV